MTCCIESEVNKGSIWECLWHNRKMPPMPEADSVYVDTLGTLGEDIEKQDWLMVPTAYHQIFYKTSTDPEKLADLYHLADNIYEFCRERYPPEWNFPTPPIRVFLVPGQRGMSRCCWQINALRTGDEGDIILNMGSLLHEETHLFNKAYLINKIQGWWVGEYSCRYYQKRLIFTARKNSIRKYILKNRPNGPFFLLSDLDLAGRAAFVESLSAFYFFEERYGMTQLDKLRHLCLLNAKKGSGRRQAKAVFERALYTSIETLEQEWLTFYDWNSVLNLRTQENL